MTSHSPLSWWVTRLSRPLFSILLGAAFASPACAASYPLRVDKEVRGRAIDLTVVNDGPAPVNVIIELTHAKNTGFSPAVIGRKFPHMVAPFQSKKISTAVPLKLGKPAEFGYRFSFAFGDPQAVHANNVVYRLPIPNDTRGVVRPYTGAFHSTSRIDTANALEILLPVGTPVVAARGGVVIDLLGTKGEEPHIRPSDVGNFVSILHDDGTWATYGWLADDSVLVTRGQKVAAGDAIGLSGANPDAIESYIMMVVNRNWFGLQLRGAPIKLHTAGDDVVDITTYSGQVSPNLKPKYPVQPHDEPAWVPSEELLPPPKPPVDWNDDHLTPSQRQALFRQRMIDASEAAGTDSVSGSRPLFFLAICGALLGMLGAFVAHATHASSRPAGGLRGVLWTVVHGRAQVPRPDGSGRTVAEAITDPAKVFEGASLEPVEQQSSPADKSAHQASAHDAKSPPPPDEDAPATAPKRLFSAERLQLLSLINHALPPAVVCTPSVPLANLCHEVLPDDLAQLPVDFVLVEASSGEPRACVLFTADQLDSDGSRHVSQRLSFAGIPTVSFDAVPARAELKARLKRFLA